MNPNPQTEQATAANKFTKFEVATDGTLKGTSIKVNGKDVENLSSLSFYWYGGSYCPLSLSYTVREPAAKPGELHACTTYYLRCPEPVGAYAAKAEASIAEDPQLYFAFAKGAEDPILKEIEAKAALTKKNPWAQL